MVGFENHRGNTPGPLNIFMRTHHTYTNYAIVAESRLFPRTRKQINTETTRPEKTRIHKPPTRNKEPTQHKTQKRIVR